MATSPLVATRIPPAIMDIIKADLETGYYRSISDWVRVACIEYAKRPKQDRQGGGALIKFMICRRAHARQGAPVRTRRIYKPFIYTI